MHFSSYNKTMFIRSLLLVITITGTFPMYSMEQSEYVVNADQETELPLIQNNRHQLIGRLHLVAKNPVTYMIPALFVQLYDLAPFTNLGGFSCSIQPAITPLPLNFLSYFFTMVSFVMIYKKYVG